MKERHSGKPIQSLEMKPSVKNHECLQCNIHFTRKSSLNRHNKERHMSLKEFLCTKCGRAFKRKAICVRHEKNCKVTYCGFVFLFCTVHAYRRIYG